MTDVLGGRLDLSGLPPALLRTGLACESQLRVAAATLRRASTQDVTATTAVGILGADDLPAFEALVATIEDEYHVHTFVRLYVGSFSVRFTRART